MLLKFRCKRLHRPRHLKICPSKGWQNHKVPYLFNDEVRQKEITEKKRFQSVIGGTSFAFHQMKDEARVCEKLNHLGTLDAVSNSEDPQACTLYAQNIYDTNRVIEVSEEYKLVSDTLYLTVNLIDRFLSQSCIEKHRLQLLGVAYMLIASKYEEVCAPFVEEFCFITDNTYTSREVLKMEGEVLNLLNFQLSVPTTKTFLRRFLQVLQASCKISFCLTMLTTASPKQTPLPGTSQGVGAFDNYLADLTLCEYSFLRFLPSVMAASVVFLAKWILNQPNHPWNPDLEHYTNYSASELKTPVLSLEGLRLNSTSCSLSRRIPEV